MRLSAIPAMLVVVWMGPQNVCSWTKPTKRPPFFLKEFEGHPSRGIASVFHRAGARRSELRNYALACYGVIFTHGYIVVPCSCVSEPQFANTSRPTPWDHKDPGKVVPILKYDLFVTTMWNEKHILQFQHYEIVNVDEITLSPKCDTSYQVNIAVLRLERPITFEKLAWIHTSDQSELKRDTAEVWKANAVTDRCHIFRWVKKPAALAYINRHRIDGPWMIQKRVVRFQHWHTCMGNVCPVFTPGGQKQGKWRIEICLNVLRGTRYCLRWEEDDLLCKVVPGTPVYCYIGDFQGVIGIIHNSTVYCPELYSKNAIMEGFSDALEMISDQLPIHYAPRYRHAHRSHADHLIPNVSFLFLISFVHNVFLSFKLKNDY